MKISGSAHVIIMIIAKVKQLQVTHKICNQFNIHFGLKATYDKLSWKWSEVMNCIEVQFSQLIYGLQCPCKQEVASLAFDR